jgi:hypothetical protein
MNLLCGFFEMGSKTIMGIGATINNLGYIPSCASACYHELCGTVGGLAGSSDVIPMLISLIKEAINTIMVDMQPCALFQK